MRCGAHLEMQITKNKILCAATFTCAFVPPVQRLNELLIVAFVKLVT